MRPMRPMRPGRLSQVGGVEPRTELRLGPHAVRIHAQEPASVGVGARHGERHRRLGPEPRGAAGNEARQQLVQAVGGEGRHDFRRRDTGGKLGIDAVDRRLVRLPACPHGERRGRTQEGPALEVRRRGGEGVGERFAAGAHPRRQGGVLGPGADHLVEIDVPDLRAGAGDVAGRPAVHAAEMTPEVPCHPLGTRGDRGVEVGPPERVGGASAVPAQRLDVGGDLHALLRRPGSDYFWTFSRSTTNTRVSLDAMPWAPCGGVAP